MSERRAVKETGGSASVVFLRREEVDRLALVEDSEPSLLCSSTGPGERIVLKYKCDWPLIWGTIPFIPMANCLGCLI